MEAKGSVMFPGGHLPNYWPLFHFDVRVKTDALLRVFPFSLNRFKIYLIGLDSGETIQIVDKRIYGQNSK